MRPCFPLRRLYYADALISHSPGFWSRLKEKGSLAKDAWGVIGSALGVQAMMQEMEKMQAKGELGEEELRAMEMDVTGRVSFIPTSIIAPSLMTLYRHRSCWRHGEGRGSKSCRSCEK